MNGFDNDPKLGKMDLVERLALGVAVLMFAMGLAIVGLVAWGFVEIIQWITSK